MSENSAFREQDYQDYLREFSNWPLEALLSIVRGDYSAIQNMEHPDLDKLNSWGVPYIRDSRRNYQQRLHHTIKLIKERTGHMLTRNEINSLRTLGGHPNPSLPQTKREEYERLIEEANKIREKLLKMEAEKAGTK